MIVVDSSALVAIAKEEPGHGAFGRTIATELGALGAPSLLETKMALSALSPSVVDTLLDGMIADGSISVVDFTPAMADAAVEAFRRFGKGQGHPAQLNFGDCMAYAVARVLNAPLLYKGDDFARTDIRPALRP